MTAQIALVLGANTFITNAQCSIAFSTTTSLKFGQQLGLLWLPLDADRKAVCSPAYLLEPKDWATINDSKDPNIWQLDLPTLFDKKGVHFLQLIAYVYHEPNLSLPVVELKDVCLMLNDSALRYDFTARERHVKAAIILEICQRSGQFKCRALGESSTQGLASLERRAQVSFDMRSPDTHARIMDAQVVLSDIGSDSAIIRVSDPLPHYIPLAQQCSDILGETITTLGFPLSGLSSQLQMTQGCISGLTGLNDDIRYLQFTAPIQPGSSGSPLLLPTGEVVGMVTASLVHEHAQNMNYAVKFQLLSALLASAGISLENRNDSSSVTPLSVSLTTPQLSKQSRSALWLVGCQG